MKKKPKDLSKEEMAATLDALYTAASAVKGRDGVKMFLKDLLTLSERVMLGRRIIAARMLIAGETYDAIGERLHMSKTTIMKVHKWLKDQFPGFETAIKGMEDEFKKRADKKSANKTLIGTLKKRYPLHFLLFPDKK